MGGGPTPPNTSPTAQTSQPCISVRWPSSTFLSLRAASNPCTTSAVLPGPVGIESPALRLEIRKAWDRRDIALELLGDLNEEPPEIPIGLRLADNIEDAATRVRTWLGLSSNQQTQWGATSYKALNEWRATLEAHGVLALQATGVSVSEMRGFSIAARPLPVAVANTQDAPRGRVFTFLHELVHILLSEKQSSAMKEK